MTTLDITDFVGKMVTAEKLMELRANQYGWQFLAKPADGKMLVYRMVALAGSLKIAPGEITVVDVRFIDPAKGIPADLVYIGRDHPRGWKQSDLHNPFYPKDGDAIGKFKKRLWSKMQDGNSKELAEIMRIAGMVAAGIDVRLGCWCAPDPCHGDIIKAAILHVMKGEPNANSA